MTGDLLPSATTGRIAAGYLPIVAQTLTASQPIGPVAFDCVLWSFVREGSADVFSDFGRRHVRQGDAVLLCPNTLWRSEPEESITTTTIWIDGDLLIDQEFWRHAHELVDRLHMQEFLSKRYLDTAQVLHLGTDLMSHIVPSLDELVALSSSGQTYRRFYRVLSVLLAILDKTAPLLSANGYQVSVGRAAPATPTLPRHRLFHPLRDEARLASQLLRESMSERWTMARLSEVVHLSESQLRRVFVASFGKTPLAYLTMLRVSEFARLLRTTSSPIGDVAREIGWLDQSYAARVFRRSTGLTPRAYRAMCRDGNRSSTD